MTIAATAVWRVRVAGNDQNGAGYDPAISGGTDYSQQDSPFKAATDWQVKSDDNTKVKSSTAGSPADAWKGNALRIYAGSGWTTGYYFITAQDGEWITLDRSPAATGTTGGSGQIGGAAATWPRICSTANATGDKIVAGNTVWIRGAGSTDPSSADYDNASYCQMVQGTSLSAMVTIRGENGRPRLTGPDYFIYMPSYTRFKDLVFSAKSAGGGYGLTYAGGNYNVYDSCLWNGAGYNAVLHAATQSNQHYNCRWKNNIATAVSCPSYGVHFAGCRWESCGVALSAPASANLSLANCLITGCTTGISFASAAATANLQVLNCIVNACGSGIVLADAASAWASNIRNTVFANCTTVGLKVTTSTNVEYARNLIDFNAFYNNLAHRSGINAGANDIDCSADPFVNAAGGDFTLNATAGGGFALRDGGHPQSFEGLAGTALYMPIGFLAAPVAGGGETAHVFAA